MQENSSDGEEAVVDVPRRRHKRRRGQERESTVVSRLPIWWSGTEGLFKLRYVTRAIDKGRHEHVRDFVNSDLSNLYINCRDRVGRTSFHAALMNQDLVSLLLLMTVRASSEEELPAIEVADPPETLDPEPPQDVDRDVAMNAGLGQDQTGGGASSITSHLHEAADVPRGPAEGLSRTGNGALATAPIDFDSGGHGLVEVAYMHAGMTFQSLPGMHLGLCQSSSLNMLHCYGLLLRDRVNLSLDPELAFIIDHVDRVATQQLGGNHGVPEDGGSLEGDGPDRSEHGGRPEAGGLPGYIAYDVVPGRLFVNPAVFGHVDPNVRDVEDYSLLDRAALRGDLSLCRLLVASGAVLGDSLINAMYSQDFRTVLWLLDAYQKREMLDRLVLLRCFKAAIKALAWHCIPELLSRCELSTQEFETLADYADGLGVSNEWVTLVDRSIDTDPHTDDQHHRFTDEGRVPCGIFTHRGCMEHLAMEPCDFPTMFKVTTENVENPHRLEVLLHPNHGILRLPKFRSSYFDWAVEEENLACWADVARVHDHAYIDWLRKICLGAPPFLLTNPETTTDRDHDLADTKLDSDTKVTLHSFTAALAAAECVISAIKSVCNGEHRNAFCCIRPPGHHVGTFGASQDASGRLINKSIGSQGFCLFNNVAIGAAWARYNLYEKGIRRIAIVDFDVHHGNGTECIIRNLVPRERVLCSEVSCGANVELRVPMNYAWRDPVTDSEEVMFISIHGYDGKFYPGMGASTAGQICNVPVPSGTTSGDYKRLFDSSVIAPLIEFHPDLILVSAGFDAHVLDPVGTGQYGQLTEHDFRYITERLQCAANYCCYGRLVSVLEGGYNTQLGMSSPFARSVAVHLEALGSTFGNPRHPTDQVRTAASDVGDAEVGDDDDPRDDDPGDDDLQRDDDQRRNNAAEDNVGEDHLRDNDLRINDSRDNDLSSGTHSGRGEHSGSEGDDREGNHRDDRKGDDADSQDDLMQQDERPAVELRLTAEHTPRHGQPMLATSSETLEHSSDPTDDPSDVIEPEEQSNVDIVIEDESVREEEEDTPMMAER